MTDMFPDLPEVLSPKLAWIKKHGLRTMFDDNMRGECPETGADLYPWACCKEGKTYSPGDWPIIGVGDTEEEAIWDFCWKNDVKHYSQ